MRYRESPNKQNLLRMEAGYQRKYSYTEMWRQMILDQLYIHIHVCA